MMHVVYRFGLCDSYELSVYEVVNASVARPLLRLLTYLIHLECLDSIYRKHRQQRQQKARWQMLNAEAATDTAQRFAAKGQRSWLAILLQ